MPRTLFNFTLIHRGGPADPHRPRVEQLRLHRGESGGDTRASVCSLLVVDARGMTPACTDLALREAGRLRREARAGHGVLLCNVPRLPLVVAAMRAGLRDIIHEPLSAAHMLRLLRAATPGGRLAARQVSAIASLLRGLAQAPRQPAARHLAQREHALQRHSEQLAARETRLELERAALEERERRLRASSLSFERRFAALQRDADLAPAAESGAALASVPEPRTAELDGLAARLKERAQALDIRERILQELEHILLGQLNGKPEHLLEVDTRPPFPMRTPPTAAAR